MIRPLRARHRAIFVALALLLPPALVAALASRQSPASSPLPDEWIGAASEVAITWSGPVELAGAGVGVRLGRSEDRRRWLELSGRGPHAPDVLIYTAGQLPAEGELPEGARFIGPLGTLAPAPRVLEIPAETKGWLVLYSLGDSAALGSLELED